MCYYLVLYYKNIECYLKSFNDLEFMNNDIDCLSVGGSLCIDL